MAYIEICPCAHLLSRTNTNSIGCMAVVATKCYFCYIVEYYSTREHNVLLTNYYRIFILPLTSLVCQDAIYIKWGSCMHNVPSGNKCREWSVHCILDFFLIYFFFFRFVTQISDVLRCRKKNCNERKYLQEQRSKWDSVSELMSF